MTLPVNAMKFNIKRNTLEVYDVLSQFWREDPEAWHPLAKISMQAELSDYYAVKAITIKFARAGLIEASYDVSPFHFRMIDPKKYGEAQKKVMEKFKRARAVFGMPNLPPVPTEAHNRPDDWR